MPPTAEAHEGSITWVYFALLTVSMWGLYGILMHKGSMSMPGDPNARFKAYLFVGLAYFITAVVAPAIVLLAKGASWQFSPALMTWSLIGGTVGAIGAFGVLLAFGAKGTPPAVMSIVFAGAPIVNAVVGISLEKNWANVRLPFLLGIVLAALGGFLVTLYKPAPPKHHVAAKPTPAQTASAEPAPAK